MKPKHVKLFSKLCFQLQPVPLQFGVDSAAMARKLDENDADIRTVAATMAAEEGFDRSLLIVMGDHGRVVAD